MAEQTYHALILKRRSLGESDRSLTLLTQEAGVVDVIAKGARKTASRLSGSSEPLSACVVHVAEGKKNLYVTQVQPVSSFPGLRADYDRLSLGLAVLEIAAAVLPHEQPAPEAFSLLVSSLKYLEAHPKPLVVFAWAEVKLLDLAGFMPELGQCIVTRTAMNDAMPFLSPHAGGYVSAEAAVRYTDRFQTRAEVLYGISALAETDEPPANLKFVEETISALLPFWRAVADTALPANESLVREMR